MGMIESNRRFGCLGFIVTTSVCLSLLAVSPRITPPPTPEPLRPSDDSAPQTTLEPKPSVKFADPPKLLPPNGVVRQFFTDVMVIIMMSPARYHLVDKVREHYAPFFTHMYFCGPTPNRSVQGILIHNFDIVYGNEQYRAVRDIIRQSEAANEIAGLQGYLYIADDLMLQPWSLVNHNKSNVWATQMGIANLRSSRSVNAVPGMSVEGRFRKEWPYWKKNRGKLMKVLNEGGPSMRAALSLSAQNTPPSIFKYSHYGNGWRSSEDLQWVIFFTIVDTYYVPRRLALQFADISDLMAKHWVFGECAIATTLRVLAPQYEPMHVQFYWSTLNASDCPRYRWQLMITGFHRCRHDHPFAEALYNETIRVAMQSNRTLTKALLSNTRIHEELRRFSL